MKRGIVLSLFALFIFGLSGQFILADFNPQRVGYLEAELEISSWLNSSTFLDEINHSLYTIPENYSGLEVFGPRRYFIEKDKSGNKEIVLSWKDFKSGEYKIKMKVKNYAEFSGAKRIPFPYNSPREYWEYLEESNNVAITSDMRGLTNSITSGSGDSFDAVSKISNWVYSNLKYDLKYSNVSLPSDEVYSIRRGTCDEFTNLFIAMARASGIPSRYVSGITYSEGNWGYHAWAEVYLNRWIPVDPTWNEVGWLDATHIKLGEFLDSSDVKIRTNYISSENANIKTREPSIKIKVLKSLPIKNKVLVETSTYPDLIGLGDSAVTTVQARTSTNGCITTPIEIIPGIDKSGMPIISVSPKKLAAILCPGETKEYHFIAKAPKELDKNYIYYDLADVYTPLGNKTKVKLQINPKNSKSSSLIVRLDKPVVEPGEFIKYQVFSDAPYKIYSDLPIKNDYIIANNVGSHYFVVSTKTGEVIQKNITVKKVLSLKVKDIEIPPEVRCGKSFNFSITVEGMRKMPLNIEIDVSKGLKKIDDIHQFIDVGEKKNITFTTEVYENCTGEDQFINIQVNDQNILERIKVDKPKSFLYIVFEKLLDIFSFLSSKIESIQYVFWK